MHPSYYRQYLKVEREGGRDYQHTLKALAVLNPVKAWCMDYLLRLHVGRGDKVIVFSDSVTCLKVYSRLHGKFLVIGETPENDRKQSIAAFRMPGGEVLFLSRVGDVALDVPDANVIIQLNAHYGSRLQEAQRMGRILRRSTVAGVNKQSYFYTLTSLDTLEDYYGAKRRRYLADQGYAYKVITVPGGLSTSAVPMNNMDDLRAFVAAGPSAARELADEEKIRETLVMVLNSAGEDGRTENKAIEELFEEEEEDAHGFQLGMDSSASGVPLQMTKTASVSYSRRVIPSLNPFSGGSGAIYGCVCVCVCVCAPCVEWLKPAPVLTY